MLPVVPYLTERQSGNIKKYSKDLMEVSIDRLTIVGRFIDYDKGYMFLNKLSILSCVPFILDKDILVYDFKLIKNVFVQIDLSNHPVSSKRYIRIDFNPNTLFDYEESFLSDKEITDDFEYKLLLELLDLMCEIKTTRIDVAFDFNKDLSRFEIATKNRVKSIEYRDLKGRLETKYMGSKDRKFRLYDKKKQLSVLNDKSKKQLDVDNFFRFELQLRNKYLLDFDNVFSGVYLYSNVFENLDKTGLSQREKEKIYFMMNCPEAAAIYDIKTRKKYKDMIMNNVEKIDIESIFVEALPYLKSVLELFKIRV